MSVKVVDVQKTYKLGENQVPALRGVDLELQKGEFVAFTGPSGSGKTTLLNLIGVLDKPSQGKIYVDGTDLTLLKEKDLTKLRRSTIGFIFQFYNLIPVLSAIENVELPMLIAGVTTKERENRAKELLKMVGLGDRMHHRPDELSGGEQQRVAIVRALANKPSIVLADEPTGDLDSKTGKEVMNALRDLSNHEGATVIVVTHDPTVASMASKIFEMRDGKIINQQTNKTTPKNKTSQKKETKIDKTMENKPNLVPEDQLLTEKIGILSNPSDIVRIDRKVIAKWNGQNNNKQINKVHIETSKGKEGTWKLRPIRKTSRNTSGIVQISEKVLKDLEISKGEFVKVKPIATIIE